jgi:hypothetical protein
LRKKTENGVIPRSAATRNLSVYAAERQAGFLIVRAGLIRPSLVGLIHQREPEPGPGVRNGGKLAFFRSLVRRGRGTG